MIRIAWVDEESRAAVQSVVNVRGASQELQLKRVVLRPGREAGLQGGEVKCVGMMKSSDREGRFQECN